MVSHGIAEHRRWEVLLEVSPQVVDVRARRRRTDRVLDEAGKRASGCTR